MTFALLRKDIRLLRLPLLGGALLAVLSYLLHVAPALEQWSHERANAGQIRYVQAGIIVRQGRTVDKETVDRQFIRSALLPAALTGLGLVALTAAACGSVAFAAERRDRSAEFLAMLPVSRPRAASSKLAAALVCLALPAALHLTVFALSWPELSRARGAISGYELQFMDGALNCAALTLMTFGVAWLLSSFFESPAIAAAVAVGVAAVAVYLVASMAWQVEVADDRKAVFWTPAEYVTGVLWRPGVFQQAPPATHAAVRTVATLGGISALIGGALVYVRRVAP